MAINYRKERDGAYTHFHAWSDDPIEEGGPFGDKHYPHGQVSLRASTERIARHLTDDSGFERPQEQIGQQMSFFEGDPAVIDGAFVDHRLGKGVASTLLALAYNHAKNNPHEGGGNYSDDVPVNTKLPTYGYSLSDHSSAIVQKALSANMVTPHPHNPSGVATNEIALTGANNYHNEVGTGRIDRMMDPVSYRYEEISPEDMAAAKGLVRNTVRSLREQKRPDPKHDPDPQYEQLSLF